MTHAGTEGELITSAERDGVYRYVVAAVLERGGAVLLLQRPADDFMGGIYELPSGEVEPGETLHDALRREVREETGLTLSAPGRYLGHFDYLSSSGRATRQFTFAVSVAAAQDISLSEHVQFAWVGQSELEQYDISESVRAVLVEHWQRREA